MNSAMMKIKIAGGINIQTPHVFAANVAPIFTAAIAAKKTTVQAMSQPIGI